MIRLVLRWWLMCFLAGNAAAALGQASEPVSGADGELRLLQELDEYPHAERVSHGDEEVLDHEVGLGAIKKVRGVWTFRDSERLSGRLVRYTWQIVDGFSSREVMQELVGALQQRDVVELLFTCEGRACGKSAQWANRVFRQRILYGREDLQAYSVFSVGEAGENRVVIYSAARTADRQYLHVELLLAKGRD